MMEVVSIDDILSKTNGQPSPKTLFIAFSVTFVQVLGALLIYYPNFSGYIPYTEWRCNSSSQICLSRVGDFSESGWRKVDPDSYIFTDNRCKLQISDMEPTTPTINLYSSDKTPFGELEMSFKGNKITARSAPDCQENCSVEILGQLPRPFDSKIMTSELQHSSEFSDSNSSGAVYIEDVWKGAWHTVRYAKVKGARISQLICPDKSQYTRKNLCGEKGEAKLSLGTDFFWDIGSRTSYALDWNLFCDREYLSTTLNSLFFIGGIPGLFVGGWLADMFGRRITTIFGIGCCILVNVIAAMSSHYWMLALCRTLSGFGTFVCYNAVYILFLEFCAPQHRAFACTLHMTQWGLGTTLLAPLAYLLHGWRWLIWISVLLLAISIVPVFLVPESPRFYFTNKGDEKNAKRSLQWLAKNNNVDLNTDNIQLEKNAGQADDTKPSQLEVLKEFLQYREMTIQLAALMIMGVIVAFIYYGFAFGWGKLGSDLYLSYFYAGLGDLLTIILQPVPHMYLGRRKSMIVYFLVAGCTFLVALIPLDFGFITLEQLSCLVGSMFSSAAFFSLFLYTSELAPDAQRGKMLGFLSIACRVGALLGPQANLMFEWSKQGTLVIFAVLAVLASIVPIRLPESRDAKTPATAAEVQERRLARKRNLRLSSLEDELS